MQHNVVVLLYTQDEVDRLFAYAKEEDNGCKVGRSYSRADWHGLEVKPALAYVVACNSGKTAFQLRLRFNTYPAKGVEFA